MQGTTQYREFTSANDAESWAWQHYADLLSLDPESEKYDLIFSYTGSWYKVLNDLMRICPPIGSDEFDKVDFSEYVEEKEQIIMLNSILHNYALPEPIVVYRFAHLCNIAKMTDVHILRKGLCFSDKAFVSTTLVKNLLVPFGKDHRCSCVLKMYLPQGLPGAYVSFKTDKTCLNEQEILLPPNITFQIAKIHLFTWPMQIDCKVAKGDSL